MGKNDTETGSAKNKNVKNIHLCRKAIVDCVTVIFLQDIIKPGY